MTSDSSRVLCEETQSQSAPIASNLDIIRPPQVAAIAVDYILYINLKRHGHLSMLEGLSPVKWEKIVPNPRPAPLEVNLVSFTWPRFQTKVIIHLANKSSDLRRFLFDCLAAGQLVWFGTIKNHTDYGIAVKITGPTDFLDFLNAAYEAHPAMVAVRATMDNPTRKAYEEALRAQIAHHHQVSEVIKRIERLATSTSPTGISIVHPDNHQLAMQVLTNHLVEWAEAVIQNTPGVCPRIPPQGDNFFWIDNSRKRPTPNTSGGPPIKRNTGPNYTTPPNHVVPNGSGTLTGTNSDNEDDIEIIPILSNSTNNPVSAVNPITTIDPASPELECHHMETYLIFRTTIN
ncbi:hypothetical protein PGTUg99_007238 [Puccinia graminis f. sp. tritici]|uniref:Uncharacterized protein n=1 Tax=Puccinia graminis f. sp. tritici TaxID=56615 RepID=A0A5B0PE61_PUCGR|nr:hypothetical protein PGTUg99_007238 [Puccinia graminis f. sp. tritici]